VVLDVSAQIDNDLLLLLCLVVHRLNLLEAGLVVALEGTLILFLLLKFTPQLPVLRFNLLEPLLSFLDDLFELLVLVFSHHFAERSLILRATFFNLSM